MKKFRIESVSIQAFRCFTHEQTILLNGKSTFIIGKNSWGKSSLVEAIMWCLFGGVDQEREIRNDFYQNGQAEVMVKLTLSRDKERWQVIRRLKPGQTESDAFVLDGQNKKIDITKAFPNLTRLTHGIGAHIIFNHQGEKKPNVRDLKNFEKIISEYLGLRDYDLIGETIYNIIDDACSNNKSSYYAKKRFDALLEVSEKAQTLYKTTLNEINSLVIALPWGTEVVPSYKGTSQRINDFISDLKDLNIIIDSSNEPSNLKELRNRLDIINNTLESELRRQINPVEKLINSKKILLNRLSDIKTRAESKLVRLGQLRELIDENNKKIGECEKKIADLDIEIKKIETQKNEKELELTLLKGKLNQIDKLINILDASELYCNQTTWNECPTCESRYEDDQLKVVLSNKKKILSTQRNTKLIKEIQDISSRIGLMVNIIQNKRRERDINSNCVVNNREDLIKNNQELDTSNNELDGCIQEIAKLTTQTISADNLIQIIENLINKTTTEKLELETSKNIHDALYNIQKSKLDRHYYEVHFLELEDKLNRLLLFESSQNWQKKDAALIKFISYLNAIKSILNSIRTVKQGYIESQLPEINAVVDNTYQILTEQRSYEHAEIILKEQNGKEVQTNLKFIVASENPPRIRDPETVLNEQALNALNILPYFVFTKLGAMDHEIDLIILDDPSRSYDSGRFEKLMSLLSDVEDTNQIIITTPDDKRDVFIKLEEKYFKDRVKIIELIDFDKEKGPKYQMML